MSKALSRAGTKPQYEITPQLLPLCCPLPTNRLWNAHPRVYLSIAEMGHVTCPYCGTHYTLRT